MARRFAVAALFVVACSSVDPAVGGSAPLPSSDATIEKADVERDLALEITRSSSEPIDHERDPRLEVWLVNRSRAATYPVVLANDGSESGWREPHAFFRMELLRSSGVWEAAPPSSGARCGVYASDWEKDVVALAPGDRVKMPWMPYRAGDLGDATKVRILAHYVYGEKARDKSKVPPVLHGMPEYALASAPLEIAVEHPYALDLKDNVRLVVSPWVPLP